LIKTYVEYDKPYWRQNGFNGSIIDSEGPIRYSVDGNLPEEMKKYYILGYNFFYFIEP